MQELRGQLRGPHTPYLRREPVEESFSGDILPDDFEIPELGMGSKKDRRQADSFTIEWRGKSLDATVQFDQSNNLVEEKKRDGGIRYAHPLVLAVEGRTDDPDVFPFDKLFRIAGFFNEEEDGHKAWVMNYRMVESFHRRKGLGELGMRLWVESVERVVSKYPEFKAPNIEVPTALASVAAMLISPRWLANHGLGKFAKKSGFDFGFEPAIEDIDAVRKIFEVGHGSIAEEADGVTPPEVTLRRPISVPDIH